MMHLPRWIDRAVVAAVRWRSERFNPRRHSTDYFLSCLGEVMLAETQRRNRACGSWKQDLDARDSAFARKQLAAAAREQFQSLRSGGSAGLM